MSTKAFLLTTLNLLEPVGLVHSLRNPAISPRIILRMIVAARQSLMENGTVKILLRFCLLRMVRSSHGYVVVVVDFVRAVMFLVASNCSRKQTLEPVSSGLSIRGRQVVNSPKISSWALCFFRCLSIECLRVNLLWQTSQEKGRSPV